MSQCAVDVPAQEKDATVIVVAPGTDHSRTGTLYGIDGSDGIVQLDDDIKILDLHHLAECES